MSAIFSRALAGVLFAVSAFSVSAHDMSAHTTMTMPSAANWQGEGIIKKVTPLPLLLPIIPSPR
ncbi:hypothetical protein [Pseudocitrobacter faecalis]|uniref:hypothetical protein n=1 Tax=Pseudocitrobacter faecalis TaxID=1398493 RepID=UPI004062E4C5